MQDCFLDLHLPKKITAHNSVLATDEPTKHWRNSAVRIQHYHHHHYYLQIPKLIVNN